MTTASTDLDLRDRLRTCLEAVAAGGVPVTYADVARTLGLEGPHKIHRIALALEHLMAEDAAAGRPLIAALVISRARDGLPAPGFFEAAHRLGRFGATSDGGEALAYHRAEVAAALAQYGRATAPDLAGVDRMQTVQEDIRQYLDPRPTRQHKQDD